MVKKILKAVIFGVIVATLLPLPAFAGTPHTSWGKVLTGASGDTWTFYVVSRPSEKLNGSLALVSGTYVWQALVGNLTTAWNNGDDSLAFAKRETNPGANNHTGYYAVMNEDLSVTTNPQPYNDCTMRQIPVPTATPAPGAVNLSWTAATTDPSANDHGNNIAGYNVYRSTSQSSGFTKINGSLVTAINYSDTTGTAGTTYYYAIEPVFRGSNALGVYSANSNGASPQAVPGSLQFSSATYSVAENVATVTITVTRTGGSSGAVGVTYATSNGTATAGSDYTATTNTLSWASGDSASKTFTVTILDDSVYEGNETFNVTLSAPTGGATIGTPNPATVTITDNETPPVAGSLQFSAATYSVNENGGTATITVTRTGGSNGAVGVTYATSNGTATAGSDYTATTNTLSWADGDTASKTFTVSIIDDTATEANETVNLTLSGPTGGASLGTPNTATLTINDNDAIADPTISGILPATAEVGQTIVISGSNFGATKETSTVTVGGIAANPTAWSASSITVAVPTGVATGSADVVVTVGAKNDSSPITVDGSKIMIDDYEGGSVGVWGSTQGLADSGYYAFGAGITPDNNNITANGPKAEAVKEGAKGMKVQYSFTSGWGGGWGATLANQLDLTDAKYVSFYVNWDGSANAIKLSLLDNDGTSYAATITNATLAALSGYAKVTLDKASFSYDMDGSASGSNTTFDWTKVSKYNFVYSTNGTTANYQYIDTLTAMVSETPPPPTGEAPVINSVSPSAAAGGSQITVTGLRFGSTQDNSRLDFTNLSTNVTYHANIIRWSDTTIEANVPLAPIGDYTIKVIQIRGGSGPVTALESNPASFMVTFSPTPGIATISPNPFNAGKESVTINVASSVGGVTINNIGYYIFDMTAQLVHKEVTSSTQTTWNGLDQNNAVVGDGAYILRVINEDSKSLIAKGKILVIKH